MKSKDLLKPRRSLMYGMKAYQRCNLRIVYIVLPTQKPNQPIVPHQTNIYHFVLKNSLFLSLNM